jgi:uncharacterized membrane protein affecting hemolysin expression
MPHYVQTEDFYPEGDPAFNRALVRADIRAGNTEAAAMQKETSAKARLRQATWEATQYMTYNEVRQYVNVVLDEVETDEP